MSETNSGSSSGIGFFGLLFIVFLVLKLTGYIAWSWWWVTAPLWGPLALLATVVLVCGLILIVLGGGVFLYEEFRSRRKR